MQRLASQIIGAQLFSVHTGGKIGKITAILVRETDLKLELFIVSAIENKKPLYLLSSDIRALDRSRIIIDSYDKLSEAEDLLRHQDLIKSDNKLFGTKVQTQSGKKLGKVKDYSVDITHFFVTKLHIHTNWPQKLFHETLVIDRSDIIDITKDKIVVRDTTIKAKSSVKVLPAKTA